MSDEQMERMITPGASLETQQADSMTIDLVELIYKVLYSWKLIVCIGLIFAAIAGAYSYYTSLSITPLYQATSTIYVVQHIEVESDVSNVLTDTNLMKNCIKIFDMSKVHAEVIDNLNLSYGASQIRQMLSIVNDTNTRMLDITVTSANPQEAADIANEYAKVAGQYIMNTLDTEEPDILSEAMVPTSPVSQSGTMKKNVVLSFVLGVFLAAAVVAIRLVMNDRYRTAEEIRRYAGLPTLAVVPSGQLCPVTHAGNEALNTLSTNLSFTADNVKKIVLTNCRASKGEAALCVNLMRKLAQLGKSVVLVDADLRGNTILSEGVKGKEHAGLTHLISGTATEEGILCETDTEGAYMITAGAAVEDPLPLLCSPRFGQLLDHLAEKADYVLVNAPALGTAIDAAQIAKRCDGILLVVDYNAVHRRELIDVKEQLEQTGRPILGAVLNDVKYDRYLSKKYHYKPCYSRFTR